MTINRAQFNALASNILDYIIPSAGVQNQQPTVEGRSFLESFCGIKIDSTGTEYKLGFQVQKAAVLSDLNAGNAPLYVLNSPTQTSETTLLTEYFNNTITGATARSLEKKIVRGLPILVVSVKFAT